MIEFVLLIYGVWGVYSGFQFLSGRSAFLEKNLWAKILVSIPIGLFYGVFYFFIKLLQIMGLIH
ncbi:MAG: hypothetical protein IKE58_06375 [Blautia sp.]|nr:hypothetical protein [Blautia sp.]